MQKGSWKSVVLNEKKKALISWSSSINSTRRKWHVNTCLHTLCSKNKNTFYTWKDRFHNTNNNNFIGKFYDLWTTWSCWRLTSCCRGNSLSIFSTLNLKVLQKRTKRNTFVMFGKTNRLHVNQKFKESDLNPWLLCRKCFSLGFLVMNLTDYLQIRAWAFTHFL